MNLKIIVPCFNEEKRLNNEAFLSFLKTSQNNVEFYFVNDGSSDGTMDVLNSMRDQFQDKISVLNLIQNGGKAEAVRQGIELAANQSNSDWVAFWDADLATPLEEIERFIKCINKNSELQCITGCRFKHLGSEINRKSSRHYIGRCFATVVSMMLGIPVYDTQCGAKMFRADLAQNIFKEKFISKWLFDVELFFRMKKYITIKNIYELPLNKWDDVDGSRLKFSDFLKSPFVLLNIFLHYRSRNKDR